MYVFFNPSYIPAGFELPSMQSELFPICSFTKKVETGSDNLTFQKFKRNSSMINVIPGIN